VHITSKTLDYKGYFAGGAAGKVSLSLPQSAWVAVTEAVGAGDSATVAVTKISKQRHRSSLVLVGDHERRAFPKRLESRQKKQRPAKAPGPRRDSVAP
jgi:hypothetical protein